MNQTDIERIVEKWTRYCARSDFFFTDNAITEVLTDAIQELAAIKDKEIARLEADRDAWKASEWTCNDQFTKLDAEATVLRARLAKLQVKLDGSTNQCVSQQEAIEEWKAAQTKWNAKLLALEAQCERMREALTRSLYEHGCDPCGITEALSAPLDLELLDEVKAVLALTEQDHLFPFTVCHDDLLSRVQALLKSLKGS